MNLILFSLPPLPGYHLLGAVTKHVEAAFARSSTGFSIILRVFQFIKKKDAFFRTLYVGLKQLYDFQRPEKVEN